MNYWSEALSLAIEELDLPNPFSYEDMKKLGESLSISQENIHLAYYTPPASDRLEDLEREWRGRLAEKEAELERYRISSEAAMKNALGLHPSESIAIENNGVYSYGGRRMQVL